MSELVRRFGKPLTILMLVLTAFWLLALVVLPNIGMFIFSFRPYLPVDQLGGPLAGPAPEAPSLDFALRTGEGRPVTLRLIHGTTELAPVGIHRVTLRSGDKSFTANGTCTAGTPCIELRSPLAPPRVQPVQGRRDSELLVAAMGIGGRDPLMYEALRQGARLARGSAGRHRQPTG